MRVSQSLCRRLTRVSGYHREPIPFAFSPESRNDAPGARIPARLRPVKHQSTECTFCIIPPACPLKFFNPFLVGVNCRILSMRSSVSSSAVFQSAATSWSLSIITASSTRFSITAVSDTIPPPAKGSTRTWDFEGDSHSRIWGISQVFPPGYLREAPLWHSCHIDAWNSRYWKLLKSRRVEHNRKNSSLAIPCVESSACDHFFLLLRFSLLRGYNV